ncbi:MAG TPA: alpha/beta fold hydrolase [Candidatus Elarobacter sp.]|nr:alpha/beta fold hydrolase [Candidatus Elarobacter sp.]
MLYFGALLGAGLLFAGVNVFAAPAPPSLAGHWEGTLLEHERRLPIRFDFTPYGKAFKGRFSVDRWRVMDYPLGAVKLTGDQVRFALGDDAFTGTLRGTAVTGSFSGDDGSGTFEVRHVAGTPLPYDAIPVHFRNGTVTLSGTLAMPRARGRHAAVVLVQGSGPEIRWGTNRFIADRFARAGIAALVYDKRGAGESSGEWQTASFEDLARDALAGVALLDARPDIDASRIGIHGHSQGAIVAPLAASIAPQHVAFIVAEDSAAERVRDQDLYRVTNEIKAKDWPSEDKKKALTMYALFLDVISGDKPYADLETAAAPVKNERWFTSLGLPPKTDAVWSWYPKQANYDMRTAWRGVTHPVLLVYGERDKLVPVDESIGRIEDILDASHVAYTALIVPRAEHNLTVHPQAGEPFFWWRAAPGLIDTVVAWVKSCTDSGGVCASRPRP